MKQPGEDKERLSEQRSLLPTKPKNKNEKEKLAHLLQSVRW
jgi:hypothetical protein